MGCSTGTVHKERQPSDQDKNAAEIVGTNKRGFRDVFHWKMKGGEKGALQRVVLEKKEGQAYLCQVVVTVL